MNEWRSDDRKWCYFHPRELVVGICALCLKERLLLLASKKTSLHKTFGLTTKKSSPSSSLSKIFALTTLLNRLEVKDRKLPEVHDDHHTTSSPSPDDSFISIKFEDNGATSWEKGKFSETKHDQQCGMSSNNNDSKKKKSLVEQSKPRGSTLRWRRRIGHLFQLIRLKRSSSKANVCHVASKPRKTKLVL